MGQELHAVFGQIDPKAVWEVIVKYGKEPDREGVRNHFLGCWKQKHCWSTWTVGGVYVDALTREVFMEKPVLRAYTRSNKPDADRIVLEINALLQKLVDEAITALDKRKS